MSVFRSNNDYYHFAIWGSDSLDQQWRYVYGNNGWVNEHWTLLERPVPLPGNVGYVNMSLSTSVAVPIASSGTTIFDPRAQDRLTLDNHGVSSPWVLSLSGVEFVDAPLTEQVDLEIINGQGFTTDGSLNSLRMNVGAHDMVYTGATRDSTIFTGVGYDTVTLEDHPDIPGEQYWTLIRRADGQVDAYSLYSGHRIRMEGGYQGWGNTNGTMNYGMVEQINLSVYDSGNAVFYPGADTTLDNDGEIGNQKNIDLRSYEWDGSVFVDTPKSNSFNLAYFNLVRYTTDNVWVGEATVHDGAIYSTPSNTLVSSSKYAIDVTADSLEVIGSSRNGSHDLIVEEQASTAIDGNLRLYVTDVESGLYNEFNRIYLGTNSSETTGAAPAGSGASDRQALFGFGGEDTLVGGSAKDYLFGGESLYSQITGDDGNHVTGGAGADYFGVGNTDTDGVVSGLNATTPGSQTSGYATDVILDWDAGVDTLVVLSNGVAVIGGLSGQTMSNDNLIDLESYDASVNDRAVSDQAFDGPRGNDTWDDTESLLYVYNNQGIRDSQSIKSESFEDITVRNEGLVVSRGLNGNDTIIGSSGDDYIYGNREANLIVLNQGGEDRVYFDTFFGKQYVNSFSEGSGDQDLFYVNKAVIDAFGGNSSRGLTTYDSSGSYTSSIAYNPSVNFLHSPFYSPDGYPATNAQHTSADGSWNSFNGSSDSVTFGIGAGMVAAGYALSWIPGLGSALIATGSVLGGLGAAGVVNTQSHQNATYNGEVGYYLNVLSNNLNPNTTAASTSARNEDNRQFLDFFIGTDAGDGYTPVLEFTHASASSGVYGYYAVHSDDETFIYLVASQDKLVENSEAIKVGEINGSLEANDFVVYNGTQDIYNQVTEAAIVLAYPTISAIVDSISNPVTLGGTGQTSNPQNITVSGTFDQSISAGSTISLYDGINSILTGQSASGSTFSLTDSRSTIGTQAIRTDASVAYTLDNTLMLQDSRVAYRVELTDGLTGIITRSSTEKVRVSGGSATIDGGGGSDILLLNETSDFFNNLSDNRLLNVENIVASGTAAISINLADQTENFTVSGTAENDTLAGGSGSDTINSGNGNDIIYGNAGNDNIAGGEGVDTIYGGENNDTISGDNGNDLLFGENGNDSISSGDGNDLVDGGAGNDTILGGAGNESIVSGEGNDLIVMASEQRTADTINGGNGTDTLTFTDNNGTTSDLDHVTNVETIILGNAATNVTSVNALISSGQTLTVNASSLTSGNTLIWNGSSESDGYFDITGGAGADTITGGALSDTIYGGAGADTFIMEANYVSSGVDQFKDFKAGSASDADIIDFYGPASINSGATGTSDDLMVTDYNSNTTNTTNPDITLAAGGIYVMIDNIDGVIGSSDFNQTANQNLIISDNTNAWLIVGNDINDTSLNVYQISDSDSSVGISVVVDLIATIDLVGGSTIDSLLLQNIIN